MFYMFDASVSFKISLDKILLVDYFEIENALTHMTLVDTISSLSFVAKIEFSFINLMVVLCFIIQTMLHFAFCMQLEFTMKKKNHNVNC